MGAAGLQRPTDRCGESTAGCRPIPVDSGLLDVQGAGDLPTPFTGPSEGAHRGVPRTTPRQQGTAFTFLILGPTMSHRNTSPANDEEAARLAALYSYEILDTPPDGAFDRVTALAARHFNAPVALVSLVDEDRIWFKSRRGLDTEEIPRSPGLCASVILSDEAYVVTNALEDPRTLANPLVAGEMGLRFYAAAPLVTHDGHRLGTLNVIDFEPRELDADGCWMLHQFAGLVMDQMELRLSARKAIASLSQIFLGAERSDDLKKLITVSAWSRKIQVDNVWVSFEEFLVDKLGVSITHGIDPESAQKLQKQMDQRTHRSG